MDAVVLTRGDLSMDVDAVFLTRGDLSMDVDAVVLTRGDLSMAVDAVVSAMPWSSTSMVCGFLPWTPTPACPTPENDRSPSF